MKWTSFFILFFSFSVQAAIINIVIDENEFSFLEQFNDPARDIRVFAGFLGNTAGCDTNIPTCNTCERATFTANNPDQPCNIRTVLEENADLRVTFGSDTAGITGNLLLTIENDAGVQIRLDRRNNQVKGTVSATWQEICNAFITDTTPRPDPCNFDEDIRAFVGIGNDSDEFIESEEIILVVRGNSDNTPLISDITCSNSNPIICETRLVRGDEKVFIDEFVQGGAFPQGNFQLDIRFIRFFYEEAAVNGSCALSDFQNVDYNSPFIDTEISIVNSDELNFNNSFIEPFVNETTYCFRVAAVDNTGTVFSLTDIDETTDPINQLEVTPSLVSGLIEEGNCFIATAAYGDPLHEKIEDFRQFRDQVLLKSKWGREFVDWYYANSYAWANRIADQALARQAARILLWPLWAIAYTALHMSWLYLLIPLITIIALRKRATA